MGDPCRLRVFGTFHLPEPYPVKELFQPLGREALAAKEIQDLLRLCGTDDIFPSPAQDADAT
jgi:hypothetical protein